MLLPKLVRYEPHSVPQAKTFSIERRPTNIFMTVLWRPKKISFSNISYFPQIISMLSLYVRLTYGYFLAVDAASCQTHKNNNLFTVTHCVLPVYRPILRLYAIAFSRLPTLIFSNQTPPY